jgi:hypothetical protein
MDVRHVAIAAETHLNDLQADMEASSRLVSHILHKCRKLRDPKGSDLLEALLKQVRELKACMMQQRKTMQVLRQGIGRLREHLSR